MLRVVVGALVRDDRVLLGHRSPTKRAYPDVPPLAHHLVRESLVRAARSAAPHD